MRDTEAVKEHMVQGDLFEMVTKVQKQWNFQQLVDQQNQNEYWFNDNDANIV